MRGIMNSIIIKFLLVMVTLSTQLHACMYQVSHETFKKIGQNSHEMIDYIFEKYGERVPQNTPFSVKVLPKKSKIKIIRDEQKINNYTEKLLEKYNAWRATKPEANNYVLFKQLIRRMEIVPEGIAWEDLPQEFVESDLKSPQALAINNARERLVKLAIKNEDRLYGSIQDYNF